MTCKLNRAAQFTSTRRLLGICWLVLGLLGCGAGASKEKSVKRPQSRKQTKKTVEDVRETEKVKISVYESQFEEVPSSGTAEQPGEAEP